MAVRDRKNFGLFMPGSVLTVTGILFFICTFTGWGQMEELWPLFIMAPGIGFVMMYAFGKHERGLLIPAGILIGLGLIFLADSFHNEFLWPIVLILVGLLFLLRWKKEDVPATPPGTSQGPGTIA
jgi:hypothetical protein